ncbi:PaaI family thioesterase [Embleya sp. NBC_00888]|uniref:PaaI family thioesterase n=1 Tax=Embleya sp. NBC_00888 TaxID=2975960 RepID=UPI00386A9484|nr:PaaI family thioesterase [Embleya sp. NBC_00888]
MTQTPADPPTTPEAADAPDARAAREALDFARSVLAAQPFSRLVGARVTAFGAGEATLEVDVRDELRQQNGYLHGGVLAYAADNAITFAAGSTLGSAVLTGSVSVQYLRPALGVTLRADARIVHAGRRQAVCDCTLTMVSADGGETVCAIGRGTVLVANGTGT